MTEGRVKMNGLIPLLQTNSLSETIEFYTRTLGFEVASTYPPEGEPGWCMLRDGSVSIMFSEHADHDGEHDHDEHAHEHDGEHHDGHVHDEHPHDDGDEHGHDSEHNHHAIGPHMTGMLYFYPEDVDALFEQIKDDVEVEYPLGNQPHGMREFAILDNNGYRLAFGQEV